MKRLLLTAIVALALCVSGYAQLNPNGYETHYAFNEGQFELVDYPVAHIALNGEIIDQDGNWADLEIASFVGNDIRGHNFLTDEWIEYGWPYPLVELPVRYNPGAAEEVSFRVFDHATGIEYLATCNITIHTGEEHTEIYMWDWDNAVVISYETGDAQTFEKEITGYTGETDHYYLIASPIGEVDVEDANVTNLYEHSFELFYFDQTQPDQEWQNYTVQAFSLVPGKGYLYASDETFTLTFTGTPYTGDGGVDLDYDDTYDFGDVNIVGNPFGEEAYLTNFSQFYVLNGDDDFILVDNSEYDYVIEPMQGILLFAQPDQTYAEFEVIGEAGGSGFIIEKNLVLNLTQGRGVVDRAIIRFGEGSTLPKYQLNSNNTKVYFPMDSKDYAVVNAEEMGEMPVNFKAGKNGTYTLSFTSKEVAFNYLHLVDNLTGADVDLLATPSYTFEASVTDYASRFKLVFATGEGSDDNFAFYSNGSFVISNQGEATLQVVDVTGRILSSETINGSASVNVKAAAGVYMLRLVNGDNVKVQKVVIE